MKPKQILITVLCACTLFTFTACGKTESFSLQESRSPAPSAASSASPVPTASVSPTPTPTTSASASPAPSASSADDAEISYIGNKATKIFHSVDCNTLPSKKNRRELHSRDYALKAGYKPCKNCNP